MHNPINIRRGESGRVGKGGPLWSPGGGACSLSIDEPTSSVDPWRVTIRIASPMPTQRLARVVHSRGDGMSSPIRTNLSKAELREKGDDTSRLDLR